MTALDITHPDRDEPPVVTEFLLCGTGGDAIAAALAPLGVTVFDPSNIHLRIREANAGTDDERGLQVPIVPGSVWTRLTQIVSRQRAGSPRWAVASDDLALFAPIWQHLMPAAQVISPDSPADEGVFRDAVAAHL